MGVAIKLWSLPLPPSVRNLESQCHPYQALHNYVVGMHDQWYGRKKQWVNAVMQTISRRRKEGNLKDLIYRKPPGFDPKKAEPLCPRLAKPAKGSVAMELLQDMAGDEPKTLEEQANIKKSLFLQRRS